MLVVLHYDWFGSKEALYKWDAAWAKACKDIEGISSCKKYTSHQARYHYSWIMKMDSYDRIMEALDKMPERDRNALTHSVLEIFTES